MMNLSSVLSEQIDKQLASMNFSSKHVEDFVMHEHPVYVDREFKDAFISHLKRTAQQPHARFKNSQDMMLSLSNEGSEMVSHLIIKALSKCEASAEDLYRGQNLATDQDGWSVLDKLTKLFTLLATPSGVALLAIIVAALLVLLGHASFDELLQIFLSRLQ